MGLFLYTLSLVLVVAKLFGAFNASFLVCLAPALIEISMNLIIAVLLAIIVKKEEE